MKYLKDKNKVTYCFIKAKVQIEINWKYKERVLQFGRSCFRVLVFLNFIKS